MAGTTPSRPADGCVRAGREGLFKYFANEQSARQSLSARREPQLLVLVAMMLFTWLIV
jgi:hypothetical protein